VSKRKPRRMRLFKIPDLETLIQIVEAKLRDGGMRHSSSPKPDDAMEALRRAVITEAYSRAFAYRAARMVANAREADETTAGLRRSSGDRLREAQDDVRAVLAQAAEAGQVAEKRSWEQMLEAAKAKSASRRTAADAPSMSAPHASADAGCLPGGVE